MDAERIHVNSQGSAVAKGKIRLVNNLKYFLKHSLFGRLMFILPHSDRFTLFLYEPTVMPAKPPLNNGDFFYSRFAQLLLETILVEQ